MTVWYYFENDGQKRGPYSHAQLMQIVQQGTIMRETFVEDQNGRICAAEEVKGLVFPKKIQPLESYALTEPVLEFEQAIPQSIPVPIAERNMTMLWIIIVGVLTVLIVAVAGMLIIRNVIEKKLITKLNTITKERLEHDIIKDLPLEISNVEINWTDKSSRNASGSFTAIMITTEELYESVDDQFALRKLVVTDPYDFELNDARRKNNALPVSSRIPEDRLDWPRFYDVLVPKEGEITLTGIVELTKNEKKDWQVEKFSVDSFSYSNKTFFGDQLTPGSRLWTIECRLDDPNTKSTVNTIIQNRRKFVSDVSFVRVPTPTRPIIDNPPPNDDTIPVSPTRPPINRDQEDRREYAERIFSQVSLDFNDHYIISEALQFYNTTRRRDFALELRGVGSDELAKASREKNWLKMISILEGQNYTLYPEAKTIDSAFQKLQSGDKVQMLLKGNFVGLPLDQIYMLEFRNFETVRRSANFNNVQNPTELRHGGSWGAGTQNGWIVQNTTGNLEEGLRYSNSPWKQHPDGAGYYRGFWPLRWEQSDWEVLGRNVEITHRCFVLQISRNGVSDYCNNLNNTMKNIIIRLRERIKLGEITSAQAEPLLESEYNRILAEALDRARKR